MLNNNRKGFFYGYVNQKRKVKESVPPLMNKKGDLGATHQERDELLKPFFASGFTRNLSPHPSRQHAPQDGHKAAQDPPTVREDQVSDHLRNLNIHKAMAPGEMRPRDLKGTGSCSCPDTPITIMES